MKNTYSKSITTIGTFDGVHLGHQKILQRLVEKSKKLKLVPTVLTLFPHPRMVLHPNEPIKLLHTIDERISFLKRTGINNVVVKEFTKDFSNLSPRDYVKNILVDDLKTDYIIIGHDHHFGKNRSANITDLKVFAEDYNFTVEEISAQDVDDVTISSTKIRNALNEGEVTLANSFLGYDYFITGKVVEGDKLGRKLGFPTANIHIKENYKLIPKDGVYVVKSTIDDAVIFGMMNIGSNPTVGKNKRSIEVHFFDFKNDLYSKTLKVEFLSRLRDEVKFENVNALRNQLEKDKTNALNFIAALK
ncbi:bifunctional riboflavin kinase/FAD synthetase [Winogradskyella sp. A3E31]|uniref:bifunctional riboflavin kinase/FAD synthetase n=1 Tax=Winogradskyella sp. A3E31 TaxID=3349637 RepID=UPI00398B4EDC